MTLWLRILFLLKVKGRAALDRAEDPRALLDHADEQQHELLRKVKQGLIEVAISKRQLDQQAEKLRARVPWLAQQARRALEAGREDLARLALERKQAALAELDVLEAQVAEVAAEEWRLGLAEQQLAARSEEFQRRRLALSARYTAAEAQVRVQEALSGVAQDFAALGLAMEQAEEKVGRMLAHAAAVDAFVDSGLLGPAGGVGDGLQRELSELTVREAVEEELDALRAELSDSPLAPRLPSGS